MKATSFVASVIGAAVIVAGHAVLGARPVGWPRLPAARGAQPSRSVWDGVYSAAQAKRGEAVYLATCAVCHAADLRGIDESPPLVGGRFTSNWNGTTLGDLFDRLRLTMPLSAPGTLTRQQNVDVLAYVLSANRFPAGQRALPSQVAMLGQIRFVATKPGGR